MRNEKESELSKKRSSSSKLNQEGTAHWIVEQSLTIPGEKDCPVKMKTVWMCNAGRSSCRRQHGLVFMVRAPAINTVQRVKDAVSVFCRPESVLTVPSFLPSPSSSSAV